MSRARVWPTYLRQKGPLPVAEACDYARQAALGLQHAHERRMVHRDVKPHNLMRTPDGQIKILDFGIARFASVTEAPGQAQLTGAGVLMGTADYIAPEQASDARSADIRADVYSLGCTLYELLTGRVPFHGGSLFDKVIKHSADQPEPPEAVRPDLPQGLSVVVAKMMAKNPADRFPTPAEVAKALAPFAVAASATVTHPPRPTPVGTRARQRGPWRWVAAAVAVALLLAGVAAGVAVYRIATDEDELVITPESPDAHVVISRNGKQVEIVDTKTNKRVKLPSGTYELSLAGDADGLKLSTDHFTLKRGDTVLATVRFVPKADAKAPDANVLVVATDGSGRFKSAREALLEAKDGDTVRIKPGTYKEETLVIHNDVTVEGDGPAGGVVIESSGTVRGFHLLAGRVVLRNLSVRSQAACPLVIEQGNTAVEDCTFTTLKAKAASPPAVWVGGDAKVRFLRTRAKGDPKGCGFSLLGRNEATLEDCEVVDNAYQGIWVGEEAHATVRHCRIHDNKMNGVFLDGEARATIEDCEISGNAYSGVTSEGDSSAVVRKCRVHRNLVVGLAAGGNGSITAEDCELTGNVRGPYHREGDGTITPAPVDPSQAGEVRRFEGDNGPVLCVAYSPDGKQALSGGADKVVHLWDALTGTELGRFEGHTADVLSVAFSPDGKQALSGGRDSTVRLWDVEARKGLRRYDLGEPVWCVAFSPRGNYVAAGGDKEVRLWDVKTWEQVGGFGKITGNALAFSPDGRHLLVGGYWSRTVRLWDVENGKELRRLNKDPVGVRSVAISPDGRYAIAGVGFSNDDSLSAAGEEHTVRLWETDSGREIRRFVEHQYVVLSVAFTPDGRRILSGSFDKTMRLWDVGTGKEIHRFEGHANAVWSVAASPDGRHALSAGSDGTIRLWRLPAAGVK